MLKPCIAAGLGIAHFAQDLLTAFEWTQALKNFIFFPSNRLQAPSDLGMCRLARCQRWRQAQGLDSSLLMVTTEFESRCLQ